MTDTNRPDVEIELLVGMSSFANAKTSEIVTVPREKWESMTPAERRAFCQEQLQNHIDNEVDAGYSLGADAGSDES